MQQQDGEDPATAPPLRTLSDRELLREWFCAQAPERRAAARLEIKRRIALKRDAEMDGRGAGGAHAPRRRQPGRVERRADWPDHRAAAAGEDR